MKGAWREKWLPSKCHYWEGLVTKDSSTHRKQNTGKEGKKWKN
jgi:hypothetical protein